MYFKMHVTECLPVKTFDEHQESESTFILSSLIIILQYCTPTISFFSMSQRLIGKTNIIAFDPIHKF